MVLINLKVSRMWRNACYDFVKKSRKKDMFHCHIFLLQQWRHNDKLSNFTGHNCSISAAIVMCQWHRVHRTMMILSLIFHFLFPPLSPSVPPYCRSCSLSCCLSSFQPSCSLTPAPPPCSTSHRPTTSQSPSSPRLASTGPPAWCAAHRITPTPWRWGWWCWIVSGMIGAFCYNFGALKLKIGQNIEMQIYNIIFWNYTQRYNPPEWWSFLSVCWLQRKNTPLNEIYMLSTVVI